MYGLGDQALKLSFKDFEKLWWERVGCDLNESLARNGQFDG